MQAITKIPTPTKKLAKRWQQLSDAERMEFRNGRLVVPVKGFYHLYGFLDLYQSYGNEAMAPGMPDSITMRFYKSNILKPDEEALIETFRPYERSANKRFMIYQSFLGADVELDAGDEVYLKGIEPNLHQEPVKKCVWSPHVMSFITIATG
uniref:THD domain-containing protein n=1 Tax=Magallana gigas TaxID=29159 RepID=A0A8W8IN21_MAGGI